MRLGKRQIAAIISLANYGPWKIKDKDKVMESLERKGLIKRVEAWDLNISFDEVRKLVKEWKE